MKIGETLPVEVQGIKVADATIVALDNETVTFVVPGVEVVVGIRHSLTDEVPEKVPEVDRVLLDEPVKQEQEKPPETYGTTVPEPRSLQAQQLDSSILDD